ncbi:hypothetical protein SUGI_1012690 [Cryptomeria japonica]|nr:hypothetical protein SUGI_1012690 [Cryptomeria japonica]
MLMMKRGVYFCTVNTKPSWYRKHGDDDDDDDDDDSDYAPAASDSALEEPPRMALLFSSLPLLLVVQSQKECSETAAPEKSVLKCPHFKDKGE